jgi:predicted MPP superfamily phosphohydrolase
VVEIIVLLLAAIGHTVLWVALVNRAHALGIKRRWVDLLTLACIAMFGVMPLAVLAAFISVSQPDPGLRTTMFYAAAATYVVACAVVCVVAALQRLHWRFHAERKGIVTSNHTTRINVAREVAEPMLAPGVVTWLGRLPGNQVLKVAVQEKQITLPRLTAGQGSVRIAHLTDLHMSGRMTRPFYEYVVDQTNRSGADIIAITGDIVDSDECLAWIPEVLGRLRAPGGVFYVLGNHDKRVDQTRLRAALSKTDWTHIGGSTRRLRLGEIDLIIGGNERPWFGPPCDFSEYPEHNAVGLPLRIALSHSPDQFGWACTNEVDLLLAGHVHGGQICLPFLGPFTAPSMHGVRYAAGTFCADKTVLHVSRGTASLTPLRWNCPPEIAILSLASF